ncbi:MAG TPA: hypothetical protein VF310_03080, partial [Vicinamibacteria bacterium]
MKTTLAAVTAAALGSATLLSGCRESTHADALLVQCGEGRQALVRTAQVGGRAVPQVECVPAAPAAAPVLNDAAAIPQGYAPVYPQAMAQTVGYRPLPVIEPAAAPAPVVYRDRPVTRRVAYREPVRRTQGRSWKKSALIIGGAAAGGAGLGAVLDGGRGAKKGAVIGGVAGTIYDIA